MNRTTAGRPGYPPRHAPYYPPPGPPRSRDGYRRGPSPNRDYRDRRDRDDYYRERRYDDRRPPLSPPGPDFRRWSRDDRGPPPPAARYDSRERDGYGRPSDDRYPGRVPARGPSPTREPRVTVGPVHPNLSGRPSKSTYEAAPVPITQQQTPEVPVESNYGYGNGYQNASATYNSGEFENSIFYEFKKGEDCSNHFPKVIMVNTRIKMLGVCMDHNNQDILHTRGKGLLLNSNNGHSNSCLRCL